MAPSILDNCQHLYDRPQAPRRPRRTNPAGYHKARPAIDAPVISYVLIPLIPDRRLSFSPGKPMTRTEGCVMVTKHRPSFDPKSFLARVGDGRSICKYPKGQVVFSQGDPGDAVFYIQKGRAKLTVVSEHGKEVVIAILGVEEFFGEGCLAGQAQRIATVTTMTDSVIARLEK
jgi:hypothetical protein